MSCQPLSKAPSSFTNCCRPTSSSVISQVFFPSSLLTFIIIPFSRSSFRESNGARPDAKRIAVLIVDEGDDLGRAKYESLKLRSRSNVEVFVIGVGKELDEGKLRGIASESASQHVFIVSSYDELPMLIYRVKQNMCPGNQRENK